MLIRLILFAAIALLTHSSARAAELETREAWISKSQFDGKVFRYGYVAYDAGDDLKETVKVNCEFTTAYGPMMLKAVEVKVLIQSAFTKAGAQVKKDGSVNVRQAIDECQKVLPGGRNEIKSPVAVRLPQISVPSEE